MAKLSYEYKLPGRSVPEVHGRFEDALLAFQRVRDLKYGNRKITAEAFTNAVMMHFLDMGRDAQEAVLREYVPRFGALVGEEDDIPVPTETVASITVIDRDEHAQRRAQAESRPKRPSPKAKPQTKASGKKS